MKNKTVYILAGGSDRKFDDYSQRLHDTVSTYVAEPRILSCFFSSEEDTWEAKASDWGQWFAVNFSENKQYAYATRDNFEQQVSTADVVYFHGGDSWLLLENMGRLRQLPELFAGKVVIGSSAGANMLSKQFWSGRRAQYGEGRGLVDKNIMVHYGAKDVDGSIRDISDWEREHQAFQNYIGDVEITVLPEGQFIVL